MSKKIMKINLWVFVLIIFFLISYAIKSNTKVWIVDHIVALAIFAAIYRYKEQLDITPVLLIFVTIQILLHNIGVFGLYNRVFFGLEYDNFVHFFAGITIGSVLFNHLKRYKLSMFKKIALVLLITLGIGASYEIVEFLGYYFVGSGEGMFLFGPGDIGNSGSYDNAMTDLLNNFAGTIVAILASFIFRKKHR